MIVAITGASGFIGKRLSASLQREGHMVRTLGRRPSVPGVEHYPWDASREPAPFKALEGTDAVVHLAGEPVAQRWNADVKRRIHDSRVVGTRNLVASFSQVLQAPKVLVSGSAIGWYGDRADQVLTEASDPGDGFLADTCREWEAEARKARTAGARVALIRTGIVLGTEGGALAKMLTPFRLGVGGPLGSGQQWMSWIHIEDMVRLLLFALDNDTAEGPLNATAPHPVRNIDFSHALGAALGRPSFLPVPAFGLKLLFGEGATALLGSQRVLPEATAKAGFNFRFSAIRGALEDVLR